MTTETKATHTPGPWGITRWANQLTITQKHGPRNLARISFDEHSIDEADEANALVMSAAPDLLEALEELLEASDWEPTEPLTSEANARIADAQGKAQKAIAKAKGGAA